MEDSEILGLLSQHNISISSLGTDIRNLSMDVLVLRTLVGALLGHAKDAGVDLQLACMAMHAKLPEEYRAAFADRLKAMYEIDIA